MFLACFALVAFATEDRTPRASDPAPLSYAAGWQWSTIGASRFGTPLSDVAIHPRWPATHWAVVGQGGQVFTTEDGGGTWRRAFAADASLSADEELLVEVDARILELTEGLAADPLDAVDLEAVAEDEDDPVEVLDEVRQAARDAVDQLQSELEGDRWFLNDPVMANRGFRARVWYSGSGELVVARADGLYRALGSRWQRLTDQPVVAFAAGPTRWWWSAGVGVSVYDPAAGSTEDQPVPSMVRDLVYDGALYVATAEGAFQRSADGTLNRLPAHPGPLITLRPTTPGPIVLPETLPGSEDDEPPPVRLRPVTRPLVLADPETLWYAARPAVAAAGPVQGPAIAGVVDIERRDVAMLLAAGAAGPFESTDGGVTWVPVSRGLSRGPARAIAVGGAVVLLVLGGELWQLVPAPAVEREDAGAGNVEPWVSLRVLLDSSLGRRALTRGLSKRGLAAAMPQVTVEARRRWEGSDSWDADAWTTRAEPGVFSAMVRLTWRPNRERAAGSLALDRDGRPLLFVADGDVVVDDGTSPVVLVDRVHRAGVRYRNQLAEVISDLYRTRQLLAREVRLDAEATLATRVRRSLSIAEVEAKLDALTESAVTRWRFTAFEES